MAIDGFNAAVLFKTAVEFCVILLLTKSSLPFFSMPLVFMPLLLLLLEFSIDLHAAF